MRPGNPGPGRYMLEGKGASPLSSVSAAAAAAAAAALLALWALCITDRFSSMVMFSSVPTDCSGGGDGFASVLSAREMPVSMGAGLALLFCACVLTPASGELLGLGEETVDSWVFDRSGEAGAGRFSSWVVSGTP